MVYHQGQPSNCTMPTNSINAVPHQYIFYNPTYPAQNNLNQNTFPTQYQYFFNQEMYNPPSFSNPQEQLLPSNHQHLHSSGSSNGALETSFQVELENQGSSQSNSPQGTKADFLVQMHKKFAPRKKRKYAQEKKK